MVDSESTPQQRFRRRGEPFVWITASALSGITLLAVAFIVIIAANALGFFWPDDVVKFEMQNGQAVLGEIVEVEDTETYDRLRVKVGNRDLYGSDFRWIDVADIESRQHPQDVVVLERMEYGNFYGFLANLDWEAFRSKQAEIEQENEQVDALRKEIAGINRETERLRRKLDHTTYEHQQSGGLTEKIAELEQAIATQNRQFEALQQKLLAAEAELHQQKVTFHDVSGRSIEIAVIEIVRAWRPNRMAVVAKSGFYGAKIVELLTEEPRESNTEGGLFPAIFGTVMMVFIMSVFAIPFGVIAAIYLREYAKEGRIVTLVRISVNNLAGVPSIVYGVFGLGFFIYTVGNAIDQVFFPHLLPTPTFGTGGILWASLTLALLTVPVVIVSTEEALSAIPKEIREGSLGLGATKFQTLVRVLLPMSTPGILTGLILSMARAAGEVAPLMLTGAVKLAPQMPLDGSFPYIHLDRKFMHLGFHIYDLGFQSPNVEAVLPMVYVTTMLLLGIVILLSAVAIVLRNRMRKKYATGVF